MAARLRAGLTAAARRLLALRRDDSGQSALFAVCTFMLIAVAIAYTYNFGLTVSERVRLQNAADAAAYSGAVVEANTLSAIAWLNSCQTHLHAQMQQLMFEVVRYSTAAALVEWGRFTMAAGNTHKRPYNRVHWRKHFDGMLPDYLFYLIGGQKAFEHYGRMAPLTSALADGQPPRDIREGWMKSRDASAPTGQSGALSAAQKEVLAGTATISPSLGLQEAFGGDLMDTVDANGNTPEPSLMLRRFGKDKLRALFGDDKGITTSGRLSDATKRLLLPEAERLIGQRYQSKKGVRRGEMWIRQMSHVAAALAEAMPLLMRDEITYQVRVNAPAAARLAIFPEIVDANASPAEKKSGAYALPTAQPSLAKYDSEAPNAFFRYDYYYGDVKANRFLVESRRQAKRMDYAFIGDGPYYEYDAKELYTGELALKDRKYYFFDEAAGKPHEETPRRRYYFHTQEDLGGSPRGVAEKGDTDPLKEAYSGSLMCWNLMDRYWQSPKEDVRWFDRPPVIGYQIFSWYRAKVFAQQKARSEDGRCTVGYLPGFSAWQNAYATKGANGESEDRPSTDDDAADGHWHSRHVHAHSINCQPNYAPICIGIFGPQCSLKSIILLVATSAMFGVTGSLKSSLYGCQNFLCHSAMSHTDGTLNDDEKMHAHCGAALSNENFLKLGGLFESGGQTPNQDPNAPKQQGTQDKTEQGNNSEHLYPDLVPGMRVPKLCYIMTCNIVYIFGFPVCTCGSCFSGGKDEGHGTKGCNSILGVLFEYLGALTNPVANWPLGMQEVKTDVLVVTGGKYGVPSSSHLEGWLQYIPGHWWTTYDWETFLSGDFYFWNIVGYLEELIRDMAAKGEKNLTGFSSFVSGLTNADPEALYPPVDPEKYSSTAPVMGDDIDFVEMLGLEDLLLNIVEKGVKGAAGGALGAALMLVLKPILVKITEPIFAWLNETLNKIIPTSIKNLIRAVQSQLARRGHHAIMACSLCARPCPACPPRDYSFSAMSFLGFTRHTFHAGRDYDGDRRADVAMDYKQVLQGHDFLTKSNASSFTKEDTDFYQYTLGIDIDDGVVDEPGRQWNDNFACDRFVRAWTAPSKSSTSAPDTNYAPTVVATENVFRFGVTVALWAPHKPVFFNALFQGKNAGLLAVATAKAGFVERTTDPGARTSLRHVVTGADEPRDDGTTWNLDAVYGEFLSHPPRRATKPGTVLNNDTEGNLYYTYWGAKLVPTRYAVLGANPDLADGMDGAAPGQRRRIDAHEYGGASTADSEAAGRDTLERAIWNQLGQLYMYTPGGAQTANRLRALALGGSGEGSEGDWSRYVSAMVAGDREAGARDN